MSSLLRPFKFDLDMTNEQIVEAAKSAEKKTEFGELVHSKVSRGVNSAYGIGFLEGAEWARQQIMKNAKDGWIDEECVIVLNDGTRIDLQPDCEKKPAFEFEYAQDVCVIVLPKEY